MTTAARLGRVGTASDHDRALTHAGPPSIMLPLLSHLWRRFFHTDTYALAHALAGNHWTRFTTGAVHPGSRTIAGIGVSQPDQEQARAVMSTAQWRYLLDPTDNSVTVQRRSGIRRWQLHSRHRLGLPCAPPCGDAAIGHRWIPASVLIDGWIGPYPADTCIGWHGDEPPPVRFTIGVGHQICADTAAGRHDRRADRQLVRATIEGDRFDVVAAEPADSNQIQPVAIDADGHHLIGSHQWPWQYQPPPPAPAIRNTGGWAAATVRHADRTYDGYIRPGERRNGWLCPAFTFAVAAQVAADSYRRWCAQPDTDNGEFYRVRDDGIELVYRPATSAETIRLEEPDDGLYSLGCESWPWESVTDPGRDEDYI